MDMLMRRWVLRALLVLLAWATTTSGDLLVRAPAIADTRIPTATYFQQDIASGVDRFPSARIVVARRGEDAPPCTFVPATDPVYAKTVAELLVQKRIGAFAYMILYVPWREAAVGCLNYAGVVEAAMRFSSTLPAVRLPSISWVVLGSGMERRFALADGVVAGGPYTDPYLARSPHSPDGGLDLPTAILSPPATDQLEELFKRVESPSALVVADAQADPGPWNRVFLSIGLRIFHWLHFALCLVVLILGFLHLFTMLWNAISEVETRVRVVLVAQLGTILYIVASALPFHSWSRLMLDNLATLLFNLAFCYALFLWFGLLRQARVQAHAPIFWALVGLAVVASVFSFAIHLANSLKASDATVRVMVLAGLASVAGSRLVLTLFFLLHSRRALRLRAVVEKEASEDAGTIMMRLLGLVPFATACAWFQFGEYVLLTFSASAAGSVGAVTTFWIIGHLLQVGQAAAFVVGLSLRFTPTARGKTDEQKWR